MGIKKYRISVSVDNKTIELMDSVETNYAEGETAQLAVLFFRAMLGVGYAPAAAYRSFAKVLEAGGYSLTEEEEEPSMQLPLEYADGAIGAAGQ